MPCTAHDMMRTLACATAAGAQPATCVCNKGHLICITMANRHWCKRSGPSGSILPSGTANGGATAMPSRRGAAAAAGFVARCQIQASKRMERLGRGASLATALEEGPASSKWPRQSGCHTSCGYVSSVRPLRPRAQPAGASHKSGWKVSGRMVLFCTMTFNPLPFGPSARVQPATCTPNRLANGEANDGSLPTPPGALFD
mmetsp:Transcript_426/g.1927  ORF Transcript_426/g.1927 Transcript_426/m.1927 type:complete len:200 (-) Transcript_426:348-947(-)